MLSGSMEDLLEACPSVFFHGGYRFPDRGGKPAGCCLPSGSRVELSLWRKSRIFQDGQQDDIPAARSACLRQSPSPLPLSPCQPDGMIPPRFHDMQTPKGGPYRPPSTVPEMTFPRARG